MVAEHLVSLTLGTRSAMLTWFESALRISLFTHGQPELMSLVVDGHKKIPLDIQKFDSFELEDLTSGDKKNTKIKFVVSQQLIMQAMEK